MNNRIHLLSLLFFIVFYLNGCGFKPIYSEKNNLNNLDYFVVLKTDNSREVKSTFSQIFKNDNDVSTYKVDININERFITLLTNSDGTVSKYKVEIYAKFNLLSIESNEIICSNSTRGFSSYNVDSSEYSTEENKRIAIQQATREALEILKTKIKNYITKISK